MKGERMSSLIVTDLTVEDSSPIKAMATNPAGQATCTAKLNVQSEYTTDQWLFAQMKD